MASISSAYRLVNILSIDVAAGAVCSALFFSDLLHVTILPYGLVALALTVWIIYTVDHLGDATSIIGEASTERHRFHQRHFKVLAIGVGIACVVVLIMLFFARASVVQWGLVLAGIAVMYLGIQRYLKILKEMFVAVIYTAGVLLPSIAVAGEIENLWILLLIFQFAIVAFLNLLIFSWFDYENDLADNHRSFVVIAGKYFTQGFIGGLIAIQLILAGILMFFSWLAVESMTLLTMTILLLTLLAFQKRFKENERYRLLGDAVFLLPIFAWIWHRL